MIEKRADLTFQYNQKEGRHGWVRLTPAYSIKLVAQVLEAHPAVSYVLDPFSGTGTTGLVCAERDLPCDLFDINPFLIWLAKAKTTNYSFRELDQIRHTAYTVVEAARSISPTTEHWSPSISNIDRWWQPSRLHTLSCIFHEINAHLPLPSGIKDLLLIGFCRLVIQWSNAAFNHQSMSFKHTHQMTFQFNEDEEIYHNYLDIIQSILRSAQNPISDSTSVFLADSRDLREKTTRLYDCVITSPPYPNRMSYIRELRPYMYWLGYLREAREAGEMDWEAIGGTWGIATSRLQSWEPDVTLPILLPIVQSIASQSAVLANYVHKYFIDMFVHFRNLRDILRPGACLHYIVGNSKFYDTLLPVEELYADLMRQCGYTAIKIEPIRKRSSKKELYEFMVSCRA
jgi:hypothetical protein